MVALVGEVVRRALSVDIARDHCNMRANFDRGTKSLNLRWQDWIGRFDNSYRIVGAVAVANINVQRYKDGPA